MDQELMRKLALELLGWSEEDAQGLEKTGRRLAALMQEVRALNVGPDVTPAVRFAPPWYTDEEEPEGEADLPLPADRTDLTGWTAGALATAMRRKELSPVEVTQAFLDRIQALDGELNAFVTVTAEMALAQAREAESAEPDGLLYGVPFALKDLYHVEGVRTTAGSRLLAEYLPGVDAPEYEELRFAGGVLLGKTATHEFAFGATTDSPFHGPTRNPVDRERSPGGSSGGMAAAVAAGMAPFGMGSDTGGSIRAPAALCGVVGLKPTFEPIWVQGAIPLAWSLDHRGPITRTAADAGLVLAALTRGRPPAPMRDLSGVRIGLPEAWLETPIDPEVLRCFRGALDRLRTLGAELVPVTLPPLDLFHLASRVIVLAEAGAYHSQYLPHHLGDYGPDVRAGVELGQFVLARDYILAQRVREELCSQISRAVIQHWLDAIATPTTAIPAPRIGERTWDYGGGKTGTVSEGLLRFTTPFNMTGQPAISLPCGTTSDGLPVGLQLAGHPKGDFKLIRIAMAFEEAMTP